MTLLDFIAPLVGFAAATGIVLFLRASARKLDAQDQHPAE